MTDDTINGVSSEISLRNRITKLSEWWSLQGTSGSSTTYLLDLRSVEEHQKRFLSYPASGESKIDLVVVSIPKAVVESRSFELPARHIKFSILVSKTDIDQANLFLCGSNRKRPNPWKIAHVLLDTEELWKEAQCIGMIDGDCIRSLVGQQRKRKCTDLEDCIAFPSSTSIESRRRQFPLARLWQPDPMVKNVLFPLLLEYHSPSEESGHVWDLAAGAGRDVAFLAEELYAVDKPYQIVAIDHRYNEKETKVINDFWKRRGIKSQTKSVKLNLSNWETLENLMAKTLSTNQLAAMFCVRFWKKDLVNAIALSDSIHSGVLFGISHFCKPSVGAPWNFDHPSEKTVLERNQLSDLFQKRWRILHDEITLDSDHGRTMINFVARRR